MMNRRALTDARTALLQNRVLIDALAASNDAIFDTVETALKGSLNDSLSGLPMCDVPITEHRSAHRPGRQARLDTDVELRAFVLARIDRLTYSQIADEIAQSFPEARRISRSSIHLWWNRSDIRSHYRK